jgi:hypothetical protein
VRVGYALIDRSGYLLIETMNAIVEHLFEKCDTYLVTFIALSLLLVIVSINNYKYVCSYDLLIDHTHKIYDLR